MIQDVDETLSALLSAELSTIPGCGITGKSQITFDSPSVAEGLPPDSPRLNLYLYDVRENHSARESGLRLTRKPGEDTVGVRRAPINLDLSYLVTAYSGSDAALEHRLLSDALAVLLRSQDIPQEFLRGVLEEQGATLAVAQPDHLASADPPALWQALGGRMRPALSLVITAQFNPYETRWTRVVREMVIGVGLGTPPHGPQRPLDLSSIRVGAAGVVLDQVSETPLAPPCQCAIIEYGTGQGWEARTDAWQLWQEMAHESEEAARLVEAGGCLRSRASRYYYTLIKLIRSSDRRNDLSDRLTALYWLRLNADYRGVRPVVSVQVVRAGRDARFILRAADEKLTQIGTIQQAVDWVKHEAKARHVVAVIPSRQAEERRGTTTRSL